MLCCVLLYCIVDYVLLFFSCDRWPRMKMLPYHGAEDGDEDGDANERGLWQEGRRWLWRRRSGSGRGRGRGRDALIFRGHSESIDGCWMWIRREKHNSCGPPAAAPTGYLVPLLLRGRPRRVVERVGRGACVLTRLEISQFSRYWRML